MREFLNTVTRKSRYQIGFLVSNVELSEYALRELNNSPIKNKICVCLFHEIVDKIKEYAEKIELEEENKKRKIIELTYENEFLRKANKKIKEEHNEKYEKSIEKLKKENEEIKKTIKEIKNQNQELDKKIEKQNQEFKEFLDLILRKLN
jgi:septal ring factor EnvC (AmiA/AmiB activator)